jgi:uncharacterized protein involved in outer membrane biogenesis
VRLTKNAILPKSRELLARLHGFTKTRKARISGIIALIFFVLFSITGFFILPPYVKLVAMDKLSGQLGRRVSMDSVSLNPFSLGVTINGFEIKEHDGSTTFVSFKKLYVNLEVMSIFRGGAVIREVKLEKPHIFIARTDANTYNFSDIVGRLQTKSGEGAQEKPRKPFLYSFSNIQIIDGNLEFEDQPVRTKHEITEVNLSIPFISNLPSYVEAFVQPSFSALVNGTPLNIKGASKVFSDSRETSFDIALKDIDIPYYLAYAPTKLNVKVPSGKLDVVMKVVYRQYTNRSPVLVLTGETKVRDLLIAIKKVHGDFLKIPLLSIQDISIDLDAAKVEIGALTTEKGWVVVSRLADGKMNFDELITVSPAPSSTSTQKSPSAAAPWVVLLKTIVVNAYTVKVMDSSLAEPFSVTVDDINFKAQNVSTDKKDPKGSLALSMRVDRKGTVAIDGGLKLDPLATDLAISLKGVPLKPFQPFLEERAQVILATGTLNMHGNLTALQNNKEKLETAFKGKLWVSKLSLLDKMNAEDLLKWDSLYIGEIDARYLPLFVHIREISLSNFYSRIIINADRTINLQNIFSAPTATVPESALSSQVTQTTPATTEQQQKQAQERKIRIDKITLQGGTINFTDESIKPRFSANLLEIGGRISALTSDENKFGEVELRGKYDRYAPLEITGKVNPLRDDFYLEIKADFKDMDLTQVSSYAGRYAGYTIQKGKLSFQLEYLIVKNKLEAKNNVFIDQFSFGEPVESPDATKLPVRLAVSLLKNRNGEIKLDIPVAGELNDPKFSVGRIILKVIMNLLEKAATSPFALLGAAFGGGEQLGYAEFDPGSASLTDETKKKLDIIGKALYDRPALKMDIVGHADPEKDREGLKQSLMLRKMKTQKVRDMSKKIDETPSLDSVMITSQEYPEYLKRAYKEEKFPKPRNVIGLAKDLPVSEMEKLMLTNMKVTDDDLKALAGERARAIRDYLVQLKQVEQERLFVVETNTLAVEKREGDKFSRTDFKLK